MRRTNKIIIAILLISIMLLGVGYAAIQNITLNITGTATADPSQSNFTVRFSENVQVSDSNKVIAAITDDTNATINVSGLTTSGDTATATYTVQNTSKDLSANLSVATTNSNEEYFLIESKLGNETLTAGGATTLTVTVQLIKTPISTVETSTIGIQLTAEPVQPGQEGDDESGSEIGGSTDTTTLASVTTANIGDYINLRNNIVGTEATTDDWRILYTDGETVYAILADYLPNSTNYAANAGLDTMGTYGVYSNKNRETLLTALTTNSNWNGLANGIKGANVIGSPTLELVVTSYYMKTGTILDSSNPQLDSSIENYDLYVPYTSEIDNCNGYWGATVMEDNDAKLYCIHCEGYAYGCYFDLPYHGIRPIIALPSTTSVKLEGGILTIPSEATNGETNGGIEKEETESIETTLASVTNTNIGEYIDLGNNIVGGETTTDDWRILYVEDNKVYAILANYLPNSTGYAANAGLNTTSKYSVYSDLYSDTLLKELVKVSNWNGLANGISDEKATVTGSPTAELLMKSYNAKYGTNLEYTTSPILNESYLYTINGINKDQCQGYWLTNLQIEFDTYYSMWEVVFNGNVYTMHCNSDVLGLRPVVCLSSDINVMKEGNLWKVVK